MKKLNWKRFFKSLNLIEWLELIIIILVLITCVICLFKFLFIGKNESVHTIAGDYQCKGGLIKVCSGSSNVASYLGV